MKKVILAKHLLWKPIDEYLASATDQITVADSSTTRLPDRIGGLQTSSARWHRTPTCSSNSSQTPHLQAAHLFHHLQYLLTQRRYEGPTAVQR